MTAGRVTLQAVGERVTATGYYRSLECQRVALTSRPHRSQKARVEGAV
jgi:hypothetical protein